MQTYDIKDPELEFTLQHPEAMAGVVTRWLEDQGQVFPVDNPPCQPVRFDREGRI